MTGVSLRTDRLILRRWRPDDIEAFAAICRDPEVMRYIGTGDTRNRQQAENSVKAFERAWDEKGFGLFALELLENGSFVGFAGLAEPTFLPEVMPEVEIGWRLAREHWGEGYATEAARAALKFGLDDLQIPSIISIIQSENEASRNIAEKLGMHLDRKTRDPSCNRPVDVYRTSEKVADRLNRATA